MAYTHNELKHKTLAELRDIAKDIQHDAVQGYTQLNKDHLVVAICKALGIEMHEHHDVVGISMPRALQNATTRWSLLSCV